MKKMVLLFSHKLTPSQKQDIETSLHVKEVYTLPSKLQALWSQVPIDRDLIFHDYLSGVESFLIDKLSEGDYVLIQGDFGATYHMINFAKLHGFVPIYSVNRRIAHEFIEDGVVKKYSEFEHEFFREYEE
ncbi:MAG: hypothetical protein KAU90_06280 [Sulfurovaceae bacterium]|nr:hypothetical protein [Sulfurovaceae bacterium]